jgi:hypothetical protein
MFPELADSHKERVRISTVVIKAVLWNVQHLKGTILMIKWSPLFSVWCAHEKCTMVTGYWWHGSHFCYRILYMIMMIIM